MTGIFVFGIFTNTDILIKQEERIPLISHTHTTLTNKMKYIALTILVFVRLFTISQTCMASTFFWAQNGLGCSGNVGCIQMFSQCENEVCVIQKHDFDKGCDGSCTKGISTCINGRCVWNGRGLGDTCDDPMQPTKNYNGTCARGTCNNNGICSYSRNLPYCNANGYENCPLGYYCPSLNGQTGTDCVPFPLLGEPCTQEIGCADDLICSGVCKKRGSKSCSIHNECLLGYYCSQGSCAKAKAEGQQCSNEEECGDLQTCLDEVCRPRLAKYDCTNDVTVCDTLQRHCVEPRNASSPGIPMRLCLIEENHGHRDFWNTLLDIHLRQKNALALCTRNNCGTTLDSAYLAVYDEDNCVRKECATQFANLLLASLDTLKKMKIEVDYFVEDPGSLKSVVIDVSSGSVPVTSVLVVITVIALFI